MATTKPEDTEVFYGGGSEGKGLRRLGGHAQVERILCIQHGYPGVIIAALEARAREDLTTLPEESGAGNVTRRSILFCGHLRSLRGVIVMAPGDLDEGQNRRIRTPARATLARVCSKGQFGLSDPDARPDVHWSLAEGSAVTAWHREAAALETARKQHRELALAGAVPARRSTRRPCGETSHSSKATWTWEQRRKGKLTPGRDLHLVFATACPPSYQGYVQEQKAPRTIIPEPVSSWVHCWFDLTPRKLSH